MNSQTKYNFQDNSKTKIFEVTEDPDTVFESIPNWIGYETFNYDVSKGEYLEVTVTVKVKQN